MPVYPGALRVADFSGTGAADHELVVDELGAELGQYRRTTGEICALLLAFSGGRSSEPAAVRSPAGPDRAATDTDGTGRWWSSQQRNP